ncbi:response regulator [Denitromonas iodatirespirans]|uniref:Sensory/regulatory protein RpfC n=1 Tax=Denitromonas iodatirespirans TaxID=2795389 RepID=A0A944HAL3_DENI1|nr:response regulator [Denitromonas iodatirespirans]MBT0963580.1 response regulator [Denitromonas iodatirespirans]
MSTKTYAPFRPWAEWLFLIATLVATGAGIAYLAYRDHADIAERERQQLTSHARIVHDGIARQLDVMNRTLLKLLADIPRWRADADGPQQAKRRLEDFVGAMRSVQSLLIVDADGRVFASGNGQWLGQNVSGQGFFQAARAHPRGDLLMLNSPVETGFGVWTLTVARVITGPDGQFDGLVAATMEPDEVAAALTSARYAPDVAVSLAHDDGTLIMSAPPQPSRYGTNLDTAGSFFARHAASRLPVSLLNSPPGDDARIAVLRTVRPSAVAADHGLVVDIGRRRAAIFASWRQNTAVKAGLLLLLAATTTLGLGAAQRRRRLSSQQATDAARALADNERFLLSLIDILPGMVGYWDADLRCGFANIAYLEWFGKTPAQMRGIHLKELLGPALFARNAPHIQAALRGEAQRYERTLTKADGSTGYTWAHYIPDRVGGEVRGFFVLISDITELKQTELALRAALTEAGRFREALDHVTAYIYMKDRDHRYVYANRPTLELFGVSAQALPGSPDTRFFPPETVERLHAIDDRVFAGERTTEEIDTVDGQGRRRIYWEIKTPIYTDEHRDTVWGLCGISTDITARKLAEEALERARAAAEAASEAKSSFVANMSHEIRTPMNAVLGFLALLQQSRLSRQQQDYAHKAHTAAQSLLAILNDILDFSKVESGKLVLDDAPFRLEALLRNLSVMLSAAPAKPDVEVLFDIDPDIPATLRGDALRLQQVLLNLAGNSIKFTLRGEVLVRLRKLGDTPTATRIEFSVRDTGIGIPADRLAAIFEGFTQAEASTTRRFGGTGLGLAISQRLVGLMGGRLAVDSTPGKGSCFHFTLDLPRGADDASPLAPPVGLHLLIVDDNAVARDVLQRMAIAFGWRADTAAGGVEAVECVRAAVAADDDFDVICIDLVMPDMDGWTTIRHIRALHTGRSAPAILMVSAYGHEVIAERLAPDHHPLDAFLVKPVTPAMLFDAVAQAAGGRRGTGPAPSATDTRLAGLRLLVVEDNPLSRQVAEALLSSAGAEVQMAEDGRQAIACVQAAQRPFDAVLMDIQMPGMDGHETTRILRGQLGLTAPIIAMTANALPADRDACLAAGMNAHVAKPIDMETLIGVLQTHTGRPAHPDTTPPAPAGTAFDLATARQRLGQDEALFQRLARQFASDQGDAVVRARACLAAGDRPGAAQALHALKGLAGTLGAQALSQAAGTAEAAIRRGDAAEAVGLDRAQACLDEAIASFAQLTIVPAPPAEAPGAAPSPDAPLETLDHLLATHNMRAVDQFAALPRHGAIGPEEAFGRLEAAMARLDFSAARAIVAELRAAQP